jgi:FG-GAP repeat
MITQSLSQDESDRADSSANYTKGTSMVQAGYAMTTALTTETSLRIASRLYIGLVALALQLFASTLFACLTSTDLAADAVRITANDGAPSDNFGSRIALDMSGKTLVVGAPLAKSSNNAEHVGAAYVFVNQNGWRQVAKLSASDGAQNAFFGSSVSINGDTVVVGATGASGKNNLAKAGAAYVYVKPKDGWKDTNKQDAKLTSSNPQADAQFGRSVSIIGPGVNGRQYLVVGAPSEDNYLGAAYVFVSLPQAGWRDAVENYRLIYSKRNKQGEFGKSVAGDSSGKSQALIIGAPGAQTAYVFLPPQEQKEWQRIENGSKTETATLTPKNGDRNYFGYSVSFYGDTVAVGAADNAPNGNGPGAAYVFVQPGDAWKQGVDYNETAVLTAKEGKDGDSLGESIATNGSTVIAGAAGKAGETGAAYVFTRPGNTWKTLTESNELANPDKNIGDFFGRSVSISASQTKPEMAVGASGAKGGKEGSVKRAGAVFIFETPPKKSDVKLDQSTSPGEGVAGANYISLTGAGFPDGSTNPANVVVQLSLDCQGPASAATAATGVVGSSGDSKLLSFLLPEGLFPGKYFVSISDSADGDANFESSNCSEVSVSQ